MVSGHSRPGFCVGEPGGPGSNGIAQLPWSRHSRRHQTGANGTPELQVKAVDSEASNVLQHRAESKANEITHKTLNTRNAHIHTQS